MWSAGICLWLAFSATLLTIACVTFDHAFPFDLTQFYSTVSKEHTATITVSSPRLANQRTSTRRRRIKTTTAEPSTAATTSAPQAATGAAPSTQSPFILAPSSSPSPPYALTEAPRTKAQSTSASSKAGSVEGPASDREAGVETLVVPNYKMRKITPFPKQQDTIVQTKYGQVRGMTGDVMGRDVSAFLGVPYARSPIKKRRFQRTSKPASWKQALTAVTFRPHCLQNFREDILLSRSLTTLAMSEDCLFANIWSADVQAAGLKAVLVWIHGGAFKGGTANMDETDGRVLAALGDVVVVTFNYRTGVLGFLDLLSDDAPGNQGLYDVLQLLTFVQDNIANFGGDPARVTIVGQDAGAVIAGIFMTLPKARGLFERAILQSGSPLFQDYLEGRSLRSSDVFAENIACSSCVTLRDKLRCLRGKRASELLAAQGPLLATDHHLFGPTFCERLLTDSSLRNVPLEEGMEEEAVSVKQVIMGSNSDELSLSLVLDYPDMFSSKGINVNVTSLADLRSLILHIFSKRGQMQNESSVRHLVDFFFTTGAQDTSTEALIRRMYRVFGDAAIGCPVNIFAEQLVKKDVSVFLYEFKQRAQNMVWGAWMGVPLGTEIPYVFGHPLRYPRVYSKDDLAISKRMIATWTQFAKNGSVPEQLGVDWEAFSETRPSFLEINPREAAYGTRADNGVCNLFRLALQTHRNETPAAACVPRDSSGDDIDLDPDPYETTTVDWTESTATATPPPSTPPPVVLCVLFAEDPDGPSVDYYNYRVVDMKIQAGAGVKAVFYCDPDQEMVGEQVSTCGSDGTWSSEMPICKKQGPGQARNLSQVSHFSCDFFPEPLNDSRLRVDYSNLYHVNETLKFAVRGSLARFKCFPMNAVDRVQLVGQETVTCGKYGIWTAIEPSCETIVEQREIFQRDFKDQFFLISLILVITLALVVTSYFLYSKMSVKERSSEQMKREQERTALEVQRSLQQSSFDGRREELQLLQANQEFGEGERRLKEHFSLEDLEVISILSKARNGCEKGGEVIELLDRNRNIVRRGSVGDDVSDGSSSSPETVLWVRR